MTHQAISLDAIDFSNPDGEFTFRGETYLFKQYLNSNYFIRNKRYIGLEFICFLLYTISARRTCHWQYNPLQFIAELIENNDIYIYRCIQYKEALFGFGNIHDEYYSPEYGKWIYLEYYNCKPPTSISLDEVLEKPYESFIERAAIAYNQELPLIKDDDLFYSLVNTEEIQIEFVHGSELELERLTKLAALALPEMQPLFEDYSSLIVTYSSYDRHRSIGEIVTGEGWSEVTVPKSAQQLFNLIFEYNFFTGFTWEEDDSGPAYATHFRQPYIIIVKVQAPSQHERIEAALELQSWLKGKLPDDEIRAYIEG